MNLPTLHPSHTTKDQNGYSKAPLFGKGKAQNGCHATHGSPPHVGSRHLHHWPPEYPLVLHRRACPHPHLKGGWQRSEWQIRSGSESNLNLNDKMMKIKNTEQKINAKGKGKVTAKE